MQSKEKVFTISQVQKMWDGMAAIYPEFDSTPQGFYFSLVNIMNIGQAKNVLEVGCGRCLLVPYCLKIKNKEATYLATDLSPKMLTLGQINLKQTLESYESKLSYEEWCVKNKLKLQVANGEELIPNNTLKFDRIICNMVLMLTEDPKKMLNSLYQQAEEGCLLGLSVWGNKDLNLIQQELERVIEEVKYEGERPKLRSNFHLYNKVPAIAEQQGWKLVTQWEQVNVFPYLYHQSLDSYVNGMVSKMTIFTSQQREWVCQEYLRRQKKRLEVDHQALTFPAQILIFKK